MKNGLLVLAASFMVAGVSCAHADDNWRDGLYMKAGGGWSHAQQQTFSNDAATFNDGYAVSGAVGWKLGNGVRTEAELAYHSNDVDNIKVNGTALPDTDGKISSVALMGNAYYDFQVGGPFIPYVGAGIGVARVNVNDYSSGNAQIADQDSTKFAYQAIAGGRYDLGGGVDLFGEYKYFATTNVDLGNDVDGRYHNHTLMAGLQYNFD